MITLFAEKRESRMRKHMRIFTLLFIIFTCPVSFFTVSAKDYDTPTDFDGIRYIRLDIPNTRDTTSEDTLAHSSDICGHITLKNISDLDAAQVIVTCYRCIPAQRILQKRSISLLKDIPLTEISYDLFFTPTTTPEQSTPKPLLPRPILGAQLASMPVRLAIPYGEKIMTESIPYTGPSEDTPHYRIYCSFHDDTTGKSTPLDVARVLDLTFLEKHACTSYDPLFLKNQLTPNEIRQLFSYWLQYPDMMTLNSLTRQQLEALLRIIDGQLPQNRFPLTQQILTTPSAKDTRLKQTKKIIVEQLYQRQVNDL
jgi:hypothetical protein